MPKDNIQKVAVIGGGAAGFFAAISCQSHFPSAQVTIYEKTHKLLAKVKVSGGGRCNVTNACPTISAFAKSYPRGGKQLKKAFEQFNSRDTISWFQDRGVTLKTEPDQRMFPITDNSQTIIDCLLEEAKRLGVRVLQGSSVTSLEKEATGYKLTINGQKEHVDALIIASGGGPKESGFDWIKQLNHSIETPVPSLFTFNMPSEDITKLMGLVAPDVVARIEGTKLTQRGPLLITHWGMSGPAILKLSAWGARVLHGENYAFAVHINWLNEEGEHGLREKLTGQQNLHPKGKVVNHCPLGVPKRLWLFLVEKAGISEITPWSEMGKKQFNRLMNLLLNDVYDVKGKTTFKEEFVTCGGVSLQDIDFKTMESRSCPNLYFAGEVIDIDGITGGFNFQAAWTTGFIAGKHCLKG